MPLLWRVLVEFTHSPVGRVSSVGLRGQKGPAGNYARVEVGLDVCLLQKVASSPLPLHSKTASTPAWSSSQIIMPMDTWNYFGPSATALRNMYDARSGESTEAAESDYGECDCDDTDESAAVNPLEANLSRYLQSGLKVRALSTRVASALDEL